ncbi:hypothetical protein GCM10010339_84430 [Streptomyces alanosinicus]|uniref:Transposase n=1 Tax=Streptomyces alanosinicus TaxID=68171 RepID=A0A919D8W9_9ACTN|nr:hypothetical protein GCM10010339_84430 [Streptomyces alanosinicus]
MNHETLRQWIKTAEKAERPEAVAESAKDAEIAALRKQVRELEKERDILRRAVRQVRPGHPRAGSEQHPVDHFAVIGALRVRELMSPHHEAHLPSRRADPPNQQEPSEAAY